MDEPTHTQGDGVLLDVAGNVLLRADRVLVQVRLGALTPEVLGAIEVPVRRLLQASKEPVGFIAILDESAPVADAEIRARQRSVITQLVARGNARLAVVIMGDGVGATLRRTLVRTTVLANPRVDICATPANASRIMSVHTGMPAETIADAVARARRLAEISHVK
jgi:hypothetical protein